MRTIAFATCQEFPELVDDDKLLIDILQKHNINYQAIPWDAEGIDWKGFSAVIVRSAWDYALKAGKFLEWIDMLQYEKVNVWNPASVLRWNVDKKYLFELEQKGVPIIPTVLIPQGAPYDLEGLFKEKRWERIVFKSTIDHQGRDVFYGDSSELSALKMKLDALVSKKDALAQPFVESVRTEGEYSFIFIGGEYSHAALKVQTLKELQTTRRTGGVVVRKTEPPESFIEEAKTIMRAVETPLLYARVDAVNIDGRLHVMEIECIEPVLYFQFHPPAAEHFAQEIADCL